MEPYDFDKLIRDRVLDEGNLHSREASNARQGIWMDIQDRVKKNPAFISWYHLAASILLLIVGFSIILFKVQNHYKSENETLLVKIEKLEKNFTEGASLLDTKDQQIKMLTSNMSNLENTLAELSDQQNDVPVTKVIYKTDTVFLKTVEYVTYVPETSDGNQEQGRFYYLDCPIL